MSTPRHSPLPWKKLGSSIVSGSECILIVDFDYSDCSGDEDQSNAELIIAAVNSHAHLVESNRRLIESLKESLNEHENVLSFLQERLKDGEPLSRWMSITSERIESCKCALAFAKIQPIEKEAE